MFLILRRTIVFTEPSSLHRCRSKVWTALATTVFHTSTCAYTSKIFEPPHCRANHATRASSSPELRDQSSIITRASSPPELCEQSSVFTRASRLELHLHRSSTSARSSSSTELRDQINLFQSSIYTIASSSPALRDQTSSCTGDSSSIVVTARHPSLATRAPPFI